jgi:hypothetical protein
MQSMEKDVGPFQKFEGFSFESDALKKQAEKD